MNNQQKKNRLLILSIFALSIVPVIIAWLFSINPDLLGKGINQGYLVIPPLVTKTDDFSGFDSFSEANKGELARHWLLVNVIAQAVCNDVCLEAMLKTKQLRQMLNKDLSRTRRMVMVVGGLQPADAEQLWLKDSLLWRLQRSEDPQDKMLYSQLLHSEQALDDASIDRLIGKDDRQFALMSDLIRVRPSAELLKKLYGVNSGELADGMLFLIDPEGNLMMRYAPGFDPYKVKSDLLHLLKISQIG